MEMKVAIAGPGRVSLVEVLARLESAQESGDAESELMSQRALASSKLEFLASRPKHDPLEQGLFVRKCLQNAKLFREGQPKEKLTAD